MAPVRRATAKDVAVRAGVSRTTVSYVLNDIADQQISPETRARVLAAADELGYVRNAAALQLRTGTNSLVVSAFPAWPIGPAMADAITATATRLTELGYTALIDLVPSGEPGLDATCARTQPIGLCVAGLDLTPALADRVRRGGTHAIVAVSNRPLGFVPTIVLDQDRVTRAAVRHVVDRGRRRLVALMAAEPALKWFRLEREAGARAEADALGVELTVLDCELNQPSVAEACARALHEHRADAVVAYNDEYGLLALHALLAAGARVPDDVAVIGCDDLPIARLFAPHLTSVDPQAASLGTLVADSIHRAIEQRGLPDAIRSPEPVIVQRQST